MQNSTGSLVKLNEGKTKIIYQYDKDENLVVVHSKDRITAGNAARSNELEGKAEISNETTSNIFEVLNDAGLKTHFVRKFSSTEFLAYKCEMIPIEFVVRRIATGSFLKSNPSVEEGYKFCPVKLQYYYKDDANNDPQWSREQILSHFSKHALGTSQKILSSTDMDILDRMTTTVFEVLEKYWSSANCQLIDYKVEYGYNTKTDQILLADIIDSDSWRLWPHGDKKLMVDKQVYRDLAIVTEGDLKTVLKNFRWVSDQIKEFNKKKRDTRVVVIMGSSTDLEFCKEIQNYCSYFKVECQLRVASAHKQLSVVEKIVSEFDGDGHNIVFIAVAGRSNGLGPVLSGLTCSPVINCPPVQPSWAAQDIWSSLRLPSGLGCTTVLSTEAAALAACQILGMNDSKLWGRLKIKKLNDWIKLMMADQEIRVGDKKGSTEQEGTFNRENND